MSDRFLIGLTGNIATGKSTVGRMLADLGATLIDADRIAHEVTRAGTPLHAEIVAAFGTEMVRADGEIDRNRLGAVAFADPAVMARLEAIIHPAVLAEVGRQIAAAPTPVVVVEAIKLIESGMAAACDSLWVTACRPDTQVERLIADRGLSREEGWLRVRAQPPQKEKIAHADVVITTDGSLAETRAQVKAAWEGMARRHGEAVMRVWRGKEFGV